MWVRLDLSGASLWFWLGLLVCLQWQVVTIAIAATFVLGFVLKGVARTLVLGLAVTTMLLVAVSLAVFAFA